MVRMYLICLFISIGILFWMNICDVRKSVIQYTNLLLIVISNFGYYYLAVSSNLEEALLANKLAYVGGIFLPLFYFLMVLEICHINIPRSVTSGMALNQCALYACILTSGRNTLFYSKVSYHTMYGISYLEKEYGPMHIWHLIIMIVYLVLSFAVLFYSIAKSRSISRRGLCVMLLFAAAAINVYIIEKALGLKYEYIPIAYLILISGAMIPVYDSNLYTVYENTELVSEKLNQLGFITFDRRGRYKGCNLFIPRVFPEITGYRHGDRIGVCSKELQNVISQVHVLEERYAQHKLSVNDVIPLEVFELNGRFYDGKIHAVVNAFGRTTGYTVEIHDHTDHYTALRLEERYHEELEEEVQEKTLRIREIQRKIVLGIAQMVESRDLSTGGHIKRTSDVVEIFAKRLLEADLGLDRAFLKLVIRSAPMHDLGKIGVDDVILRKQGNYTAEEYNEMKKHSEIGYHMVKQILADVEEPDFVRIAGNVAHYHHEKMDGTGYPHGLKGEEIPVEARIMALADVFDALVSKRCYKEAFTYDKAFGIIEHDAGTHFDSALTKIFLSCRKELEEYYNANLSA